RLSGGQGFDQVLDVVVGMVGSDGIDTFTHGDFCLPNLLVLADGDVAIIDWGKAGAGGRHRDFSSLCGSLERNGRATCIGLLCDRRGISEKELLRWREVYSMLDWFWYCYSAPNERNEAIQLRELNVVRSTRSPY